MFACPGRLNSTLVWASDFSAEPNRLSRLFRSPPIVLPELASVPLRAVSLNIECMAADATVGLLVGEIPSRVACCPRAPANSCCTESHVEPHRSGPKIQAFRLLRRRGGQDVLDHVCIVALRQAGLALPFQNSSASETSSHDVSVTKQHRQDESLHYACVLAHSRLGKETLSERASPT